MNWEAIGSIAQLLGAVGVIASLLYLAVQIRQNTRATRLATSRSTASAVREWNQPMLNDADLAWTFQVGAEDPSRLDAKERARFYYLCSSFFRMFEDLHYQYVKGALDDEVWEGYVRHYGAYAKAPGMQGYWAARRHVYHPGFRDFLETYVPPAFDRLDAIVERGAGKGETPEPG